MSKIHKNRKIHELYPLNCRYGIVPNSLIRASLPDIYRIDKKLGKTKTKKFISLVENGYFRMDKNTIKKSMTANDFFDYCKIESGKGDHKHIGEKEIIYHFKSVEQLMKDFILDVTRLDEEIKDEKENNA